MSIDPPHEFPPGEVEFFIQGPAGKLQLLTHSASDKLQAIAVICHPHPLYEGTMHNKVIFTLSRAFHHKNISTIRFNFRGVGESEGVFGDSIGEVADLLTVLKWAEQVGHNVPLYLAGFSFGAFIAASGAERNKAQQLITIAPAISHQPYETLGHVHCPWVVLQGENDEVVSPQEVYEWFRNLEQEDPIKRTLVKIHGSGHFFHGDLIKLREILERHIIPIK